MSSILLFYYDVFSLTFLFIPLKISLWLMGWLPFAVIVQMGQFGGKSMLTPVVALIPSCMTKIGDQMFSFWLGCNSPIKSYNINVQVISKNETTVFMNGILRCIFRSLLFRYMILQQQQQEREK